jgi:hypothetical protein
MRKETKKIAKLFKEAQIKSAFRTRNTIQNVVKPHLQIDKYEKSGIYQMKHMDCPLKYVGQIGRKFQTRYKEHIRTIRNNNDKSGYSNHILNAGHAYGSITDTMKIVKIEKKGKSLKHTRKYHIYKMSKNRLRMNDTYTDVYNSIFEVLQELNTR